MSLEGRLRELDHRHQNLKALIAHETRHPSVDTLYIRSLKVKKLKIKEELDRIKETYDKHRTPDNLVTS
jgi:hypothetical protein